MSELLTFTISKAEPSHSPVEPHFTCLYHWPCPFCHLPEVLTVGEGQNVDRPEKQDPDGPVQRLQHHRRRPQTPPPSPIPPEGQKPMAAPPRPSQGTGRALPEEKIPSCPRCRCWFELIFFLDFLLMWILFLAMLSAARIMSELLISKSRWVRSPGKQNGGETGMCGPRHAVRFTLPRGLHLKQFYPFKMGLMASTNELSQGVGLSHFKL